MFSIPNTILLCGLLCLTAMQALAQDQSQPIQPTNPPMRPPWSRLRPFQPQPQQLQPPTTQPTTIQPIATTASTPAIAPTTVNISPTTPIVPATTPAKPAHVTFSQGLLTVVAEDSSLSQIFREISHLTGIKIIGSTADDRVYGSYGPAPPAEIFATLLDGSSYNFVFSHLSTTGELTLSRQSGGAEPPATSPNITFDNNGNEIQPTADFQPQSQPDSQSQPTAPAYGNSVAQPVVPNAALTPQQVADRIAEMQRQRQQQTTPPQN